MLQKSQIPIDYDREIGKIDKAIIALGKELEELVYKRYELVAGKHDLNADDLIQCIVENDLMPKDVTELIVSAMEKAHSASN